MGSAKKRRHEEIENAPGSLLEACKQPNHCKPVLAKCLIERESECHLTVEGRSGPSSKGVMGGSAQERVDDFLSSWIEKS